MNCSSSATTAVARSSSPANWAAPVTRSSFFVENTGFPLRENDDAPLFRDSLAVEVVQLAPERFDVLFVRFDRVFVRLQAIFHAGVIAFLSQPHPLLRREGLARLGERGLLGGELLLE